MKLGEEPFLLTTLTWKYYLLKFTALRLNWTKSLRLDFKKKSLTREDIATAFKSAISGNEFIAVYILF